MLAVPATMAPPLVYLSGTMPLLARLSRDWHVKKLLAAFPPVFVCRGQQFGFRRSGTAFCFNFLNCAHTHTHTSTREVFSSLTAGNVPALRAEILPILARTHQQQVRDFFAQARMLIIFTLRSMAYIYVPSPGPRALSWLRKIKMLLFPDLDATHVFFISQGPWFIHYFLFWQVSLVES